MVEWYVRKARLLNTDFFEAWKVPYLGISHGRLLELGICRRSARSMGLEMTKEAGQRVAAVHLVGVGSVCSLFMFL